MAFWKVTEVKTNGKSMEIKPKWVWSVECRKKKCTWKLSDSSDKLIITDAHLFNSLGRQLILNENLFWLHVIGITKTTQTNLYKRDYDSTTKSKRWCDCNGCQNKTVWCVFESSKVENQRKKVKNINEETNTFSLHARDERITSLLLPIFQCIE